MMAKHMYILFIIIIIITIIIIIVVSKMHTWSKPHYQRQASLLIRDTTPRDVLSGNVFIWAALSFESFSLPTLCALHAPELLGTIAWCTQLIARSSGVEQSLQHIQHHLGSSLQIPDSINTTSADMVQVRPRRADQSPQHT